MAQSCDGNNPSPCIGLINEFLNETKLYSSQFNSGLLSGLLGANKKYKDIDQYGYVSVASFSCGGCEKAKDEVCSETEAPTQPPPTSTPTTPCRPCPQGWVYFNQTNKCYGVFFKQKYYKISLGLPACKHSQLSRRKDLLPITKRRISFDSLAG